MARILILDDDNQLRTAIRRMLQEGGHQVIEAREGREAIRMYRQMPVDLFLSDIFMPGKEGLETIRELHEAYPHLRILAMSGGGFDGKVDMLPLAKHLGARGTLRKPFDKNTLLALVEEVLHSPVEAIAE
jgi:DNA-binding NtrC family response regulator